jgi:DNA-binding MarR family transcriptional regulator
MMVSMTAATRTPTETAELAGRLRLSVTRLARLMRQQADTGLSPTQLATLATVEAAGPVTLGDLAGREQVAPPTMTKAVGCLEGQGLVARHQDAEDRRVSRLSITPEGRRLLERSRTRKNAWLARRLSDLDATDRQRLAEALDALDRLTQ